jgi:hypothetical protein
VKGNISGGSKLSVDDPAVGSLFGKVILGSQVVLTGFN